MMFFSGFVGIPALSQIEQISFMWSTQVSGWQTVVIWLFSDKNESLDDHTI
jgi:hypothetical protein